MSYPHRAFYAGRVFWEPAQAATTLSLVCSAPPMGCPVDGSARVFAAATGAELARLDHDGAVNAVAFSPDGTRVVTGSADGSARVFDVEPSLILRQVLSEFMTRPLGKEELRRFSLPGNCRHVEHWLRRRAEAGNAQSARDLVDLLLSRCTEETLSEAEGWCDRLTRSGEDMRTALGAVAAGRGQFDRAVRLWEQAASDGDARAALNLAPVKAVRGDLPRARELLRTAAHADHDVASTAAAILDRTATAAEVKALERRASSGVTAGLNFLGLAALWDGNSNAVLGYWSRSAEGGDWCAPLLLAMQPR